MTPKLHHRTADSPLPTSAPGSVSLRGRVAEAPTLFTSREGRPGASFVLELGPPPGLLPRPAPRRISVVGWDHLVGCIQHLRPGHQVAIVGAEASVLRRVWGRRRRVRQVVARKLEILG